MSLLGQKGVLGRSEPKLLERALLRQEPRRRMEQTGKKGRKWLGVRNWGRQVGECQWADTKDTLGTVVGRGEARRKES